MKNFGIQITAAKTLTALTSAGSEKRQPSFPKTCICPIHRPAHHCASQPGKVGGVAVECVLVGKMLHPISLRSSPRTTLCKAAAARWSRSSSTFKMILILF